MNSRWNQIFLVALAALLVSCSSKDEDAAATDAKRTEAAAESEAESAKDLDALVDLIVSEAAGLPRAEFDPGALAAKLGRDPQVQFEWVRDHTWWAPYRGLLRGSKGVMLDRVGSNLDRAVLLGDLLRRSGHTVRLAHANLPESQARELVAVVRPIVNQRGVRAAVRPLSAERQRVIETIIPGYGERLRKQESEGKRYIGEAARLIKSQADQIHAAVQSSATATRDDSEREAVQALQDHWWIERQDGGQWVAMDVLLPTATAGTTVATATSHSQWKATSAAPEIPESDWHSVRFSVVIERYESGTTTESVVLETTLRPAEVIDRPVSISHLPRPWPDVVPNRKTNPNALADTVVSVKEWVPYFRVGQELVAQSGFTEGGEVKANPLSQQRAIAETGGASITGGMDMALGGGETASSFVTAEWIDYEVHVPGASSQRQRRPVFDLLGPARRAAKVRDFDAATNDRMVERYEALLSRTDIYLQPCELTGDFVAHLLSAGVVANQDDLKKLAQERDPAQAKTSAAMLIERLGRWGRLPDLAVFRSQMGNGSGDWFIDRPNVLIYHVAPPIVNADRSAMKESIDLASNAVAVRRGSSRNPFQVRLEQGVADTVTEMLVLGVDLRASANTASIFAGTTTESRSSVLIGARDTAAVRKLGWPEDAAERLADTVGAGFMALALQQPVELDGRSRVGWWRIDPRSGETVGVMDNGLHTAATEKAEIEDKMEQIREYLRQNPDDIAMMPEGTTAGEAQIQRALNDYLFELLERSAAALL